MQIPWCNDFAGLSRGAPAGRGPAATTIRTPRGGALSPGPHFLSVPRERDPAAGQGRSTLSRSEPGWFRLTHCPEVRSRNPERVGRQARASEPSNYLFAQMTLCRPSIPAGEDDSMTLPSPRGIRPLVGQSATTFIIGRYTVRQESIHRQIGKIDSTRLKGSMSMVDFWGLYKGARNHNEEGCCWERQWMVPRPHTRSRAAMPTTLRPGKRPARMVSACTSRGSLNVGTNTVRLAI